LKDGIRGFDVLLSVIEHQRSFFLLFLKEVPWQLNTETEKHQM